MTTAAIRQATEGGQSLWLDNITRDLLDSGTLARYIRELSVTGLTSNPSIFDAAIGSGTSYDAAIRAKCAEGKSGEALFTELALEDLRRAADLFAPVFTATQGRDGWVSMEISPLLASDTQGSLAAAQQIHTQAARPNLFVKIPGTPESLPAIEEAIFAGVPVNVTLLFSCAQYRAALEAYLRQGGRFMYMGGNGFYWKIALDPARSGQIEIRRGEGGIRAWAAEPGEYYNQFDAQYGGLWRRNARPPQKLVGVGFTAQGNFVGSHYRIHPAAPGHFVMAYTFLKAQGAPAEVASLTLDARNANFREVAAKFA